MYWFIDLKLIEVIIKSSPGIWSKIACVGQEKLRIYLSTTSLPQACSLRSLYLRYLTSGINTFYLKGDKTTFSLGSFIVLIFAVSSANCSGDSITFVGGVSTSLCLGVSIFFDFSAYLGVSTTLDCLLFGSYSLTISKILFFGVFSFSGNDPS